MSYLVYFSASFTPVAQTNVNKARGNKPACQFEPQL